MNSSAPTDYSRLRDTMVEQQVRPWDVLDARVLHTLNSVPRDRFVPGPLRALAYADMALPLGRGEVMMKPVVEGRMLQALELRPDEAVLEVGTGSGFISACLAHLGARVTSIDVHAEFVEAAQAKLARYAPDAQANLHVADAMQWRTDERFDAICVTGALAEPPLQWLRWLRPGGRLFAVVGRSPAMQALLFRADGEDAPPSVLFETDLPYLLGAAPEPRFVF